MNEDLKPCALCGRMPAIRDFGIGHAVYCTCESPKKRQASWPGALENAVTKWNLYYGKKDEGAPE